MLAELGSRAEQAVELAIEAGADDVWAVATQSRDVEFNYRDGALEKVQDATSRNLSVQVYANGRYSSHRTTDLHPDRLPGFLAQAVALCWNPTRIARLHPRICSKTVRRRISIL
jgi:PmbA protein